MSRSVIYITRARWENIESATDLHNFIKDCGAESYNCIQSLGDVLVSSYVIEDSILGHNTIEDVLQKRLTSRLVLEMWDEWENHMIHRVKVLEKGKMPQSMYEYIDDVNIVPEVSPEHISYGLASLYVIREIDAIDLTVFKWAEHDWSV